MIIRNDVGNAMVESAQLSCTNLVLFKYEKALQVHNLSGSTASLLFDCGYTLGLSWNQVFVKTSSRPMNATT